MLHRVSAVPATVALLVLGFVAPARAASELPRGGWVPNKPVFALATASDRIYIGGDFTSLRNSATGRVVSRSHLAALDRTTGELVTDWAPSVDGNVRSIEVSPDGQRIFAGGDFLTANGSSANFLAAFGHAGSRVKGFSASANKQIRALVIRDGYLYVGGKFSSINGVRRVGLARIDGLTGSLDRTWVANVAGGRVLALEAPLGSLDIAVGGTFTSLDGVPRSFLGSVDMRSSQVTGWQPTAICSTCSILDIDRQPTTTYVAMAGPGGRVVAYPNLSGPRLWAVRADGDVQSVAVRNGVVYAGGHYGPGFGSVVRYQLAAVNASNGSLASFAPVMNGNPYPGVWAISADDDYLRVGGGFTSVGTSSQGRYAEFSYS